jgi:hypothetical protein
MWVIIGPLPEVPSPKDQAQVAMVPSESDDPEPLNTTLRGATPVVGTADITAVGD